jgi:hypothetical protein
VATINLGLNELCAVTVPTPLPKGLILIDNSLDCEDRTICPDPICECYMVLGSPVEELHSFSYIDCSTGLIVNDLVSYNQVKYICAVSGSISGSMISVTPCNVPPCDCLTNETCEPQARCYTVSLGVLENASFQYVSPNDVIGKPNCLLTQNLSSKALQTINICAREGSIQALSGSIVVTGPFGNCTFSENCSL